MDTGGQHDTRHESRILEVGHPSRRFLSLAFERPAGFVHAPAQVVELTSSSGEKGYFAIATAPDAPHLGVLIRASEPPSSFEGLAPGDRVAVEGPWGRGYDASPAAQLLLVAGGSAYSALRAIAFDELRRGRPATTLWLLLGVRTFDDVPDAAELDALAARGVRVGLAMSGGAAACLDAARERGWLVVAGRLPTLIGALQEVRFDSAAARVAGSAEAEDTITDALMARGTARVAIQRNYHPDARDDASAKVAPPAGIEPAQDKD